MGGQEVCNAATRASVPRHLAWAGRPQGRGESFSAPEGAGRQGARRPAGDESLSELLPSGDRVEGTIEKQEAYYRKLLGLAQNRDFAFVISFVHQDHDALREKIKEQSPELFITWRDCGLLDEKGKSRPAFDVWKKFLDSPLQK